MKNILIVPILLLFNFCMAQKNTTFSVSDLPAKVEGEIGIRGNQAPLSWDKTIFLKQSNDGAYEVKVDFPEALTLEYKFVFDNGRDVKWEGIGNREEYISEDNLTISSLWNKEKAFDIEGQKELSSEQVESEYEMLEKTLVAVHPGLYRYQDSADVHEGLQMLREQMLMNPKPSDIFIAVSKFIASIKCDHTIARGRVMESGMYRQKNKLPFTFEWLDDKMILVKNADTSVDLSPGTEINSINGVNVAQIKETLMQYVPADGNTAGNISKKLEIQSYTFRYNYFDAFHASLFPFKSDKIKIEIQIQGEDDVKVVEVQAMTPSYRSTKLGELYPGLPTSPDELWSFKIIKEDIGLLEMGDFVTVDFEYFDWRKMLKESFKEMKQEGIEKLIIDIRQSIGGMDHVAEELSKYVIREQCKPIDFEGRSRYLIFPEDIKSMTSTWGDNHWFYDLRDDEPIERNGYYVFDRSFKSKPIEPRKTAFNGEIVLLTGGKNVSASFYMARFFQKCNLGTIIGQETGGNQLGINGGNSVFLKLPYSGVQINVPVMGTFATEDVSDSGVIPDIMVKRSRLDIANNIDSELEAAKDFFSQN